MTSGCKTPSELSHAFHGKLAHKYAHWRGCTIKGMHTVLLHSEADPHTCAAWQSYSMGDLEDTVA